MENDAANELSVHFYTNFNIHFNPMVFLFSWEINEFIMKQIQSHKKNIKKTHSNMNKYVTYDSYISIFIYAN